MAKKKTPGRKPATAEQRAGWRTVIYSVRLTTTEAAQIERAAKKADTSPSTYLRDCALAAAR